MSCGLSLDLKVTLLLDFFGRFDHYFLLWSASLNCWCLVKHWPCVCFHMCGVINIGFRVFVTSRLVLRVDCFSLLLWCECGPVNKWCSSFFLIFYTEMWVALSSFLLFALWTFGIIGFWLLDGWVLSGLTAWVHMSIDWVVTRLLLALEYWCWELINSWGFDYFLTWTVIRIIQETISASRFSCMNFIFCWCDQWWINWDWVSMPEWRWRAVVEYVLKLRGSWKADIKWTRRLWRRHHHSWFHTFGHTLCVSQTFFLCILYDSFKHWCLHFLWHQMKLPTL